MKTNNKNKNKLLNQLRDDSYKILKSGVIISSARVEVEEIEKILSVRLKYEDDEFDTIGGLVMARSGQVPEKGDIIQIVDGKGGLFEAKIVDDNLKKCQFSFDTIPSF